MTNDSLLAKIAEEFTTEMRAGKSADIEKYVLKYPELAARIRELFPTLMMLEGVAGAGNPASAKSPMQPGLSPDSVFGQYRIKREIGRGGMGIVYEAVHLLLEKRVALKVLLLRTTTDAGHLERFFREARTAAGLHHTNIVPVFDVGQVGGTPYYAMEYIEGRGLDVVLRIMQSAVPHEFSDVSAPDSERETVSEVQVSSDQELQSDEGEKKTVRGSIDPSVRIRAGLPARPGEYFRWVARIGIQASEGLAHAHERKVIHRDIKPSNLLLDKQGVLWITDFGLARRVEDPAVTQSGILIGTPRYMSPEQAQAAKRPMDQRSDIYSLGATLYELLTCRPVFEGKTPHDVISQILTREPVAPRRLNAEIPADLATIVMKAMAKRPEDRYQSADQLADDLNRWLRMEPVKARRIGLAGRTIRWCRRNPKLAAVTTTAGIIILVSSSIFYVSLIKENIRTQAALQREEEARNQALDALNQAELSKQEADIARVEAEEAQLFAESAQKKAERESENTRAALKREQEAHYAANLMAADSYIRSGSFDDAEQRLDACNPSLRGWEWQHLKMRADPSFETIQLDSIPTQLTLSSDGSRVLWLSEEENEIQAADIRTRKLVPFPDSMTNQSSGTKGPPYVIAFSKDGELIARTLWKSEALLFPSDTHPAYTAISRGNILEWDPLRNILEIAADLHDKAISSTEFSQAGVWWGDNGSVFNYAINPWGNVISAVFSRDGKRFAAWTWDGIVRICRTDSGKVLLSLSSDSNAVTAVAFNQDGNSVAVGYFEGFVHLWDVLTGNQISVFQANNHPVTGLTFQPDGKQIASGSSEGAVLLWNASSGKLVKSYTNLKGSPLAFSADGKRMVVRSSDNNILVIETDSGEVALSLPGHNARIISAIFDPSGSEIISGSSDKTIRFWDINSLRYVTTLEIPDGDVESAIWRPDSSSIAVNVGHPSRKAFFGEPDNRSVIIWNALSDETIPIYRWQAGEGQEQIFNADASKVATLFKVYDKTRDVYDSEIRLLDLTPGSKPLILRSQGRESIKNIVFAPDGKSIAGFTEDSIAFWDTSSGKLLKTMAELKQAWSSNLAYSPDGSRLLSAGTDETLKIWDVPTGKLLGISRGHKGQINKAVFSPDGSLVLSSSLDQSVRVWDSSTGRERFSFSCANADAIFKSDGSLIYAGCGDGTLGVWDARTGRLLDSFKSIAGSFRSLSLSPDQSRLIAGIDKTIKIWDASSLTLLLTIPTHDDTIKSVAFSPDGSMILSVGVEGRARIWKSKRLN